MTYTSPWLRYFCFRRQLSGENKSALPGKRIGHFLMAPNQMFIKRKEKIMIQEIEPHEFNNQYCPQPPVAESYGLCYEKNSVLIRKNEDGTFGLPTFRELAAENEIIYQTSTYLFSIDKQMFFLTNIVNIPKGFYWKTVTKVMKSNPHHLAFGAITGYQLFNWYENRKYCGRCGAGLLKNGKSRCLFCPSCGHTEYPKIAPAVIIAVTSGNKLLLASYPNYDKYALLAGFAEIGETLEETVKREVMEEAGLTIKNIRYYKSQPWSLSDNLLIGFFCEVDGTDKITFDKEELSNAEWFERQAIPLEPDYVDGSLTFDMMGYFKETSF